MRTSAAHETMSKPTPRSIAGVKDFDLQILHVPLTLGRVEKPLAGSFLGCPTALLWETPIHIQHSHSKLWGTNNDTLNRQPYPIGLLQHVP